MQNSHTISVTKKVRGLTPVMKAILSEDVPAAKKFIEAPGTDLEERDSFGRTPLIVAVEERTIPSKI